MSDAQYRLLIQRSFDEELNKQEHRALIEHLESSESGAKFHHQLDQMIQAAQDTPLPDELRPQNPEALARMIMEQLPQKKGSVFGFLGNLFSGLSKGKSSAPAPQKQKVGKAPKAAPQKGKGRPGKPQEDEDMQEQEDSGSASRGPGMKFPRKGKELNADQIESQVGGFGRLKSIGNKAQELEDNRESQSTTRSLGEKFSMPWANQEGPNEGPLTLAESIKRKVTESQKLSPIDEDDMTGSQNDTGSSGFGRGSAPSSTGTEGWSAPISMPNQPAAPQADWAGGSGGGFAANSQPPNFAQQPGISQSGMGSMPKPQAPQPFGQQPAAFNKPDIGLADKGERGSAIGLAPQAKPEPIKAAPGSGTGTDWGGGWSGGGSNTEQSGWGNQAQPAPAAAPAPQAEAPKADWGSGWATPSDQRQPLKSSDSWAMPGSEGAGAWGAANNNNAEPEPQQAAPAPAPAPAAADPWGAPQAPAASMDGVGSMGSAGMGNMGSAGMAPSNSGVNMQAQQPAAPAWGQEPANDNAGWNQAANWGNEQVASAPAPIASAPQPVAADPWAQAVPAQIPAPQAAQAPAQDPNMAGWGAQPAAGGWNQAPAPAPVAEMPQQQQAADPWAQPIAQAQVPPVEPIAQQPQAAPGGWGMPATSPQEALQQQAAKAPAQKRSWATAEPDLIETGTFRAFTPTMDNALGAKSKPAAAPGGFGGAQPAALPQAGATQDNRWDIPISERNKMPEAAQAAPAPVAPVQAQPADNRWDLPIQERVKMQQDGQQVVAAQAPQPISPVGMPGQPGGGIPVNQIVDKMDQVLAGGGQAQGQPSDDRWDVPIQERIKQGQGQPAMAPEPAPAQINNGWQAAPEAPPAPMPVSGWGEVAQPAQTSNSGWPQTAPTPVQQGAGWAQEAPAAPAPAPSGWGAAAPAPAPAPAPAWNQAPAAPAPQAPQVHAEITDKAKGGGLFNINDSDIDNIFGGIGVKESVSQSVVNTGGGEAAPAPAPAAAPAPGGWGAPQMTPEPTPGQSSFAPPAGMPQPAQAPAPVAQANANNANKGLFQLDDSQVDQIFNNIGVNEPSVPVGKPGEMAQPQAFAPPPQPAAAAPAGWGNTAPVAQAPAPAAWPQGNAQAPAAWPQAAAEPAAQSWPAASAAPVPAAQPAGWSQAPAAPMPVPQAFAVDDKVMNRIFDEPQPAPGQSRDNMPVPKIEGIGRLDAGSDNSQDAGSGRIASIGKFLLDQKDLDKLGKLTNTDPSEGKMRILTLEASQDLQELLGQIGKLSGVVGSVIVGHDGLLIANTMPGDMDAESVGVWALGVYMNTQHVTSKMGHDKVHQVVSRTPRGYVVIADFGGGLLVTVTDGSETDLLIPLMRTITLLVN